MLVNDAGKKTDPVEAGVWVDTTAPQFTGVNMCANWTATGLHIDWSKSFREDGCVKDKTRGCLGFHFNVGTDQGAADVYKWQTSLLHTASALIGNNYLLVDRDTKAIDKTVRYQVTIVAFNLGGLATTKTFRIEDSPTCKR